MHPHARDRGQVLALFVIAFVGLVLVVGLVIDGSFAWVKRREAQNAADFAALAGARVVLLAQTQSGLDNSDVATAIITTAQANDGAAVTGFGTASGPQYTDGSGAPISPIGATSDTSAIPSTAAGVQVPGATVSWHPFFLGLIGVSNWTAGADATARFTPGTSGPPCSLCVLGDLNSTNSVNITTDGSVLVGGSLTGTNSATITSHNGSVVFDGSLNGTNSTSISAPNGSVYVGQDLKAVNGTQVSAPNGSVYVGRDLIFTNGGKVTAKGSVLAGRDMTMTNASGTLITSASGAVQAGRNLGATNAPNPVSSLVINYVSSYSHTNSTLTPTPTQVGSVSVPAAPTVTDPLASLPDATTAKVQQVYPNYPGSMTSRSVAYVNSQTGTVTPTNSEIWSVSVTNSSGATLYPGIYKSLASTNCSAGTPAFTLNPGTYYFDNGSSTALSLTNNCSLVATGAVTLVFLNDSGLSAVNGSHMQIQAPAATQAASATYPWPGVAIFFARGNTASLGLTNSSGTGTDAVIGTIYAPAATLVPVNSAGATVKSTVVVGTYTPTNSSPLTVVDDGSGTSTAPGPIQLVQ